MQNNLFFNKINYTEKKMPTGISGKQIQDSTIESIDIKDGTITFADFNSNINWKAPVLDELSLPLAGNILGDARVALQSASIYIWNGSIWKTFATSSYSSTDFNIDFASKTTDDLPEGTNKYFYSHNHDDLYFTEIEVTNLLSTKSDTSHLPICYW